jgi:hypothetical protein
MEVKLHDLLRLTLREHFINTFGFELSTDTLDLIIKDMIWNGYRIASL